MFALVDCNNFYASCERVFQPQLKNKPIVVLSNNDGCVIARSNEAKKCGIPMGAPAFEHKELFEKEKIHVFSSNYALYGDMSSRVMDLLTEFTPEIEVYSIDEAFLKFEGFETHFNFEDIGRKIRHRIYKGTGIPVSVGFATTKSLAKAANKVAKKFPDKTSHVYVMDTDAKRIKALKWLAVANVWGIGHQHAARLEKIGVKSAYEFTQLSDEWVKKHMSVVGLRLKKELQGTECLEMEIPASKKDIATTRSFDKNYTEFDDLKERVSTFAVTCAEKLRKQKSCANTLMVFLHTNGYRKDLPQYARNYLLQLPFPTNSAIELSKQATLALKKIFRKGYAYKKAGVIVMDFSPENYDQINLFNNINPKHRKLMETLDQLNEGMGTHKIKLASQDLERTWKMRQEKLSPRYSTRIQEAIKVKA
ncbi:MAG: Y-family DNA polymerase [Bacteroidota bacterium]|nr:Y-family DNA polymerase [Bacteroidota bacterium]